MVCFARQFYYRHSLDVFWGLLLIFAKHVIDFPTHYDLPYPEVLPCGFFERHLEGINYVESGGWGYSDRFFSHFLSYGTAR